MITHDAYVWMNDMGDLIWFVIMGALFVMIGLIFIRLGWCIWRKQKINLVISHFCDRVKEENKKPYCTLVGIGIFIMGVSLYS